MANNFPILFTGQEVNFDVPKFTELKAADERLQQKLLRQEDLGLKLQKEFREGMRVDPKTFVSDFARTQQAEAISAFENKWTKVMRDKGNKLTNADLLAMENDKAGLVQFQTDWLSSQKLWENDAALINKAPNDFDIAKFSEDTKGFLETGSYRPNSLEFSGIDMGNYFRGEKWQGPETMKSTEFTSTEGKDVYTTTDINATEDAAKTHISQTIFSDLSGRALKGVINDFKRLPEKEKARWLKDYDKDNNGIISDQEINSAAGNVRIGGQNMLDNPIVKWAQEYYLPDVLKTETTVSQRRTPKYASGGTKTNMFNIKEPLLERVNVPLGSTVYPKYYGALTSSKKIDIPLKGGRVLSPEETDKKGKKIAGTGDYDLPRDKSVQGLDFVGVAVNSRGKVELIFRLPTANWSQIEEDAGTNIAFPLEENPEFADVPLKDASGEVFTAGDLKKNTPAQKQSSGITWK
jgi:hypothetical protein